MDKGEETVFIKILIVIVTLFTEKNLLSLSKIPPYVLYMNTHIFIHTLPTSFVIKIVKIKSNKNQS